VVVFLNTTGIIFTPGEQAAFERFVRRGGGFVGIHSASDTEYDWPWYGRLLGTYFRRHPAIQSATLNVWTRLTVRPGTCLSDGAGPTNGMTSALTSTEISRC